ncbi:MAG: hypothetical protein RIT26_764 [Pseudomonadota bacterium]|jgi:lipid A 1-phosphatase
MNDTPTTQAGGRGGLAARFGGIWDGVMTAALLVFLAALLLPATPQPRSGSNVPGAWTEWVEHQGRFINTALQIGLPLITRDWAGLKSLVWVGISATAGTHVTKRLLDGVEISGIRLGQRPSGPDSHHNFPSGHSSMASSGAVFVARRYGWRWLWLLLPVLLATMFTRMALDAHTLSAVVGGAAIGLLCTWPFSRPRIK